ncbi:MAG TPA: MSMEG_4193 family putative phosphomutase [Actinomycetota bacterium]|nr:MSMEG_4193 family putative phosphomutase [Actinomycetota bacterium]
MTLVLLVRHAQAETTGRRLTGRSLGIHLSETGLRQAQQLADRLIGVPLAAVYSSPLERCTETAQVLAQPRGLEVAPMPEVVEVDYGRWTGRPLAQLTRTALWKRVMMAPSTVRFPDGERLDEVQHRSVAALSSMASRHPKRTVAVVTHAEVIRLALAHFSGVHIDLFQRWVIHPASVSAVGLGDGMPRLLRVNDTGTLEDLAARPRRRPPPRGERSRTSRLLP